MNKILVEVSVGELLDKISILEIKLEKIKDLEKLEYIKDEYDILKNQLSKNIKDFKEIQNLYVSLKKFIKLSRDVHFLNDERANLKLEINNKTGSKIKEIKEYTKY